MKKYFFVILMVILILCSTALLSCKKKDKDIVPEYYTLTLNQSIGGNLTLVLDEVSVKEGKYLSGSIVRLEAIAADGYLFKRMDINGMAVTDESYIITITSNTVAKAFFEKKLEAALAIERIKSAFLKTHDISGYEDANGISGTITQLIRDQNNISYRVVTDFSYSKSSADSYFCTEIKDSFGAVTLFGIYYFDSAVPGAAIVCFNILGQKYYTYVTTIGEILDFLYADMPDQEQENSISVEYGSIDSLEILGVIYDVQNAGGYSSFSVDVTVLLYLAMELLAAEGEAADINFLKTFPQIDFTIKIDYEMVSGIEMIKNINYTLAVGDIELNETNGKKINGFTLYGKVEVELQLWTDVSPQHGFDLSDAQNEDFEEIINIIFDFLEEYF